MTGTTRGNDRRYYRCELRRSATRHRRSTTRTTSTCASSPSSRRSTSGSTSSSRPSEPPRPRERSSTAAAQDPDPPNTSRPGGAPHLADARRELAQYRAALDDGADPATRHRRGSPKPPPRNAPHRPTLRVSARRCKLPPPAHRRRRARRRRPARRTRPGSSSDADRRRSRGALRSAGSHCHLRPERHERRARRSRFRVAQKTCRRGDLNPHAPKGTSPSS